MSRFQLANWFGLREQEGLLQKQHIFNLFERGIQVAENCAPRLPRANNDVIAGYKGPRVQTVLYFKGAWGVFVIILVVY